LRKKGRKVMRRRNASHAARTIMTEEEVLEVEIESVFVGVPTT
jgi:hypothetical protein